jgi:cytochrome b561
MTGPLQSFTALQRLLHWLMAVCILAMFFIGVGMVSTVMPKYLPLIAIHKSLGIAILVLVLIRLAVRLWYGAPALPADLPEPMKLAAYLSHYALYALMIAMPLLGWAMLSAAAYPVVVFGNTVLPAILPQSDSLHTLLWGAHFYLAFAFFALVLMHVAAALFHALIRRDGVFDAMAPWPSHHQAAALLAFDRGNSETVRAAAALSKSLEKTT